MDLRNCFIILTMIILRTIKCEYIPRIAIIGGGIGGSSTVHFLEDLFSKHSLPIIDLYEANKLGGRLATASLNNVEYELGGSVIHSRNKYMDHFRNILDLKKRKDLSHTLFGFYDPKDETFVFTESESSLITYTKLIWRYGLDPYYLDKSISKTLDSFDKIYSLQKQGKTFLNLEEFINSMNPNFFSQIMNITTEKHFTQEGFSLKTVNELIRTTLVVNFGQNNEVHAFVGSVSVAGGEVNLWSIDGGNKRVPEGLLQRSKANVIRQKIMKIKKTDKGLYILSNESGQESEPYDFVVLAAPQAKNIKNQIKFENFKNNMKFPGNYHRTVCTLVVGKLRRSYFNNEPVDGIFAIDIGGLFNSISKVNPVISATKTEKSVFKIFSKDILTDIQIKELFEDVDETFIQDWLAYPDYEQLVRNDSFVLDKHLYYLNAIEWAASAMEMSAISAKNIALLIYQEIFKSNISSPKDEL